MNVLSPMIDMESTESLEVLKQKLLCSIENLDSRKLLQFEQSDGLHTLVNLAEIDFQIELSKKWLECDRDTNEGAKEFEFNIIWKSLKSARPTRWICPRTQTVDTKTEVGEKGKKQI